MAGNAEIGALLVRLGIDTAQFQDGLRRVEGGLGRLSRGAGVAFAAVAAAAATAAVALGVAVKGALDHADAMGKAAQRVGMTVEALSRLNYAAGLSNVAFESLTGALGRLSAQMASVASGSGGAAATAFEALGIAVTDAGGQLRGADEVFADIAEKFARLEDGSTKTALAIQIFGRAGAEMIPLLNAGRDGLAAMNEESDRLGQTISGETAAAADRFNDSLEKIGKAFTGIVNKIAGSVAPALASLGETLSSPEFQQAAANFASWAIQALTAIAQVAAGIANAIGDIVERVRQATSPIGEMSDEFLRVIVAGGGETEGGDSVFDRRYRAAVAELARRRQLLLDQGPSPIGLGAGQWEDFAEEFAKAIVTIEPVLVEFGEQTKEATNALDKLKEKGVEAAEAVAEAWKTGVGLLGGTIDALAGLLAKGGEKAFGISKALSIAGAVVKGVEAVQSAWAAGWKIGPIAAWSFAGMAAATAAANIASLNSLSSSSRSMPGGASAASAPAAEEARGPTHLANITLNGSSGYSADQIRALVEQIGDFLGDGPGGSQFLVTTR